MPAVRRYRLAHDRELAVSEAAGVVALSVHERSRGGRCVAGPLAVRVEDIETIRSALLNLIELPGEEATGP